MYGKCPNCGQHITHLAVASPDVHLGTRAMWKGVCFLCPRCATVLGAGLDPLVQRAELVNDVIQALRDPQGVSPPEATPLPDQLRASGTHGR